MIVRPETDLTAQALTQIASFGGASSRLWPRELGPEIALPEGNLAESLQKAALANPAAPAIFYYGAETTYGTLWAQVEALAAALRARGLRAGDRVVLDQQNAPQFVISFYAVLRADAVVVPANPMYTGEEIAWILADSGAKMAIVGEELLDRFLPAFGQEGGLKHLISLRYADRLPENCADPLPAILQAAAGQLPLEVEDFEDLLAQVTPEMVAALPAMARGGQDLAILPYTSGTTGRPKGCITTHQAAYFVALAQVEWYRTRETSVLTGFMPFFHVAGMMAGMAHGLSTGAALVLLTRWDADLVPVLLARHRVTWWSAAPTMVVDVLNSDRFTDAAFASLQVLTGGGASMPAAVALSLQEKFGLRFCEGYGLTETISATHINALDNPKPQCLGLPIQNTLSMIVDPESLAPLAQGAVGEVWISGPQIMAGYWNRPEASAETLIEAHGAVWLRTGDLGYMDEDGCYFIVDRLKRMISVSGFKVWPAECEMVLYRHPAVREVAVIATPDPRAGERVHAVISLKPDFIGKVSAEEIQAFVREHLAVYKVPKVVEFREALPLSGSRKIDWRKIQQEYWGEKP